MLFFNGISEQNGFFNGNIFYVLCYIFLNGAENMGISIFGYISVKMAFLPEAEIFGIV